MENLIKIANKLNAEQLKSEIILFIKTGSDGGIVVLDTLLHALESKISEREYADFCDVAYNTWFNFCCELKILAHF